MFNGKFHLISLTWFIICIWIFPSYKGSNVSQGSHWINGVRHHSQKKYISKTCQWKVCVIEYMVQYTPVGAPWDGWDKANIREKDGIILDAIQGIVHLTEWQSVQLELELHLTRQYIYIKI